MADMKGVAMKNNIKINIIILHSLIAIFYIIYFYIVLQSGYLSDDALNSNVGGIVFHNTTVLGFIISNIKQWIQAGRLFPFAFYVYGFFAIIQERVLYKLLIIISIIINSILFGEYLEKITENKKIKYYSIVLLPIFIQLSCEYHSSIFSFHMLMQFIITLLFISLLGLISFIKNNKLSMNILSFIVFFIALGTYELAYTFIIIIFLTAYANTSNLKKTIKIISPHLIILVLMTSITLYLRLTAQNVGYDGIKMSLSIDKVFFTFMKQCSSTIPLIRYFVTFGTKSYPYTISDFFDGLKMLDIITVLFFFIIIILVNKTVSNQKNIQNKKIILVIATLLYVMPAMLISITTKYQNELKWGIGYLPTYMQSFGFALLCAILYYFITQLRSNKIKLILNTLGTAFVIIIIMLNQQIARISVAEANLTYRWPRENVENAISKGVLSDMKSESILLGTSNYIFDVADGKYFYSLINDRYINEISQRDYIIELSAKQQNGNVYDITKDGKKYAIYSYADKDFGYVLVGECIEIELNSDKSDAEHIAVINPKIYLQGDFSEESTISIKATQNIETNQYEMKSFSLIELQTISEDSNSKLYQLSYNGKIDIKSFVVNIVKRSSHDITEIPSLYCKLGYGFSSVEGSSPNQWLWLSNDTKFIIHNSIAQNLDYNLSFNINTGYKDISNLQIYVNNKKYTYYINSDGIEINEDVILEYGENIIKIKTNAKQVDAPGDPRKLYLRITAFNMFDMIK